MPDADTTCDVLIIGAGPAGCTAALYAARAGLDTLMLSPSEVAGMMARAPLVGNFPGQPTVAGREILAAIREQALDAGARHVLEAVVGVDFSGPDRLTVFAGMHAYEPGAVIIATGAMAPSERLPGEDRFQGLGVCYCAACDGPLYKGQRVIVVGDDEQAAEEALALSGVVGSARLVSAAQELQVSPETLSALDRSSNVTVQCGLKLQEILGDDVVSAARFTDRDGSDQTLEADGVFLYVRGAAPATAFLLGAVPVDGDGFIVTDELCQTAVAGVFAAGDVRRKQVRQMVVAAAEGATAALAAERYVRKRATLRLDRGDKRT